MWEIAFLLCVLPISLLFDGLKRKFIARFESRVGPPVWQPFFDLVKMLKKGKSDSMGNDNPFFRYGPVFYLISSFFLFLFIPTFVLAFEYDFILLIYITILCGGFYTLAAFSSNSPYAIVGAMRDIITMVTYEMILTCSVFAFMLAAKTVTFGAYPAGLNFVAAPLAAVCMLFLASIEVKITPVDVAEAEGEIMYGYKNEYSSRGLALIEMARQIKSAFFMFFLTFLFFGPINIFLAFLISIGFVFFFAIMQVTTSRLRVDHVFKLFVPVLFFAVIEVMRLAFDWGIVIRALGAALGVNW